MINSGSAAYVKCLGSGEDVRHRRLLDALLSEGFGSPEYSGSQTSVSSSEPSGENASVDSVLDFDLSLLQPSASRSSSSSDDPGLSGVG